MKPTRLKIVSLFAAVMMLLAIPTGAFAEDYLPSDSELHVAQMRHELKSSAPVTQNKMPVITIAPNTGALYGQAIQASNQTAVSSVVNLVVKGGSWLIKTGSSSAVGGCVWRFSECKSIVQSWFD